jgi:DNA recombination protein RmuC
MTRIPTCITRHLKNIVIVTPAASHIRTIDSMGQSKATGKCFEIARQAGALYDKFEGSVADLIK